MFIVYAFLHVFGKQLVFLNNVFTRMQHS